MDSGKADKSLLHEFAYHTFPKTPHSKSFSHGCGDLIMATDLVFSASLNYGHWTEWTVSFPAGKEKKKKLALSMIEISWGSSRHAAACTTHPSILVHQVPVCVRPSLLTSVSVGPAQYQHQLATRSYTGWSLGSTMYTEPYPGQPVFLLVVYEQEVEGGMAAFSWHWMLHNEYDELFPYPPSKLLSREHAL